MRYKHFKKMNMSKEGIDGRLGDHQKEIISFVFGIFIDRMTGM